MTRPTKGRAIFPMWPDEDPLVDQLTPEERERLAAMALLSDSAFLAHVAYKLMNRIEALDRYYDGLCDRLSQRLDELAPRTLTDRPADGSELYTFPDRPVVPVNNAPFEGEEEPTLVPWIPDDQEPYELPPLDQPDPRPDPLDDIPF